MTEWGEDDRTSDTNGSLLRVRRIDRPYPRVLVLTLSRGVLICGLGRDADGFALADVRPRGDDASGLVTKLRHHLEGALFEGAFTVARRFHRIDFERDGERLALFIDNDAQATRLVLVDARGDAVVSESSHEASRELAFEEAPRAASLLDANELLDRAARASFSEKRIALARLVRAQLPRADRKIAAISREANAGNEAPKLRSAATALLSFAPRNASGPATLTLLDPFGDGMTELDVVLPENTTAPSHAEALFKRARKLEHGAVIARERLAASARVRDELAALALAIADPGLDETKLLDVAVRARALGVREAERIARDGTQRTPIGRVPFRRFMAHADLPVLVGKTAADNDELTLKIASPHDVWLHARDVPGAHVVVKLRKGATCPNEALIDAAHLAAHFSESRGESVVDVEYVERRHVRKPKGSPPGLVLTQRSKNVALRVDRTRLARLLATESD
jgi:predicted ribosome quality control (RQC) complex YloA/Tae2 family protein